MQLRTHVVRVALVPVIAASAAATAFGQKSPPVRISSGQAVARAVTTCSAGEDVRAVWIDGRAGPGSDVYFSRSTDAGRTWPGGDVKINTVKVPNGSPIVTAMACDGNRVYVAWVALRDVYLSRSTDGGLTWSAESRLNTGPPGGNPNHPWICVDGSNVYVVWSDYWSSFEVRFNRSIDGGASWLPSNVVLTTAGVNQSPVPPRMTCEGSTVFVVWNVLDGVAGGHVHFNRSLDAGSTWLPGPVQVDDTGTVEVFAPVALASAGNHVYVAWVDRHTGVSQVFFDRSSDAGLTWLSPDIRISNGTGQSGPPSLAARDSSVHVLWVENRDVFFSSSSNRGLRWPDRPVQVNRNTAASANETRLCATADAINAAWRDGGNIHSNRSVNGGRTWLPNEVRLNAGTTVATAPVLSCDGGQVGVAWTTFAGGLSPVWFNIPYGSQPYGAATAGSAGSLPHLGASGTTTIGSTFTLEVTHGLGGALAAVVAGSAPSNQAVFGGTLLVSPGVAVGFALAGPAGVPGAGSFSLRLAIPGAQGLVGVPLYFQALILDPGAAGGMAMTGGREVWVG